MKYVRIFNRPQKYVAREMRGGSGGKSIQRVCRIVLVNWISSNLAVQSLGSTKWSAEISSAASRFLLTRYRSFSPAELEEFQCR